MNLGLKDKVAIVAAASKGLGKAIALGLAEEGANVAICSRNGDSIKSTADEISTMAGSDVLPIRADVTIESDIQQLIEQTLARFSRIDILVCNAGGPPGGLFGDFSADDWRKGIELNLMSTINLCRHVVPQMKQQKWGRILTVTSVAAKQPVDGLILSNASRAGVVGFSKTLAKELAADNITVNCVCPGYTLTERVEQLGRTLADREGVAVEHIYQRWESNIPMGRMGQPREFADLVVFLASERASYITGTTIQVDGGFVKGLL
jgi:3-oxoacyl-[acyl-carrier protein] reductase